VEGRDQPSPSAKILARAAASASRPAGRDEDAFLVSAKVGDKKASEPLASEEVVPTLALFASSSCDKYAGLSARASSSDNRRRPPAWLLLLLLLLGLNASPQKYPVLLLLLWRYFTGPAALQPSRETWDVLPVVLHSVSGHV